jgi:4-alpha-glucanotransferase
MLALEDKNEDEYNYTYFIQYHLHKQLREVVDYAISKGVGLKGDLPIGVNPDRYFSILFPYSLTCSTDCWLNPHLFNLDTSTGAPPDQFCIIFFTRMKAV